jgi:class 3 adenylate cyclase
MTTDPPTVLVVDDEPANLAAMSAILRPEFTVRVARSAEKAFAVAARSTPDLVLMDVDMPGVDGYTACRELLAMPGCAGTPVIFVTSMSSETAEVAGFEAGGVDYVNKPANPTLLRARIRTQLNLRRALLDARRLEAEAHGLLQVLMPPAIAEELRRTGRVQPRLVEPVAVLFADIVGFTRWCRERSAEEVVARLAEVMGVLEDVSTRHGVEKLKTIGDAYMGAVGLSTPSEAPLRAAVTAGASMIDAVRALDPALALRVGVHIGPVVAGVIGRARFRFDIWGDTVNVASRLCDAAQRNTTCVTAAVWSGHLASRPAPVSQGAVELKGVGQVELVHLTTPAG